MSDANVTYLAFQPETTWGSTPAPCVLQKLRFTKCDLLHEKMTVKSATIRDDRQTEEAAEVGVEAKGSFDFELVVGDLDAFLEAALFGTFALVGAVPTLFNGVTRKSFTLEEKFTTTAFMSYTGNTIDQMTLTLNSRQIITGQFAFLGKKGASAGATIDTSGIVAEAGTGPILTASTHVANLLVGGAPMASAKTLSLTVANNVRANDVIGSKYMEEQGVGSFAVTGKMDAYFRDATLLAAFLAHDTSAISFEVSREPVGAVSGDHTGYRFTLGRLRFTKGVPSITGKDTDVMLPIEFDCEAFPGVRAAGTLTAAGNFVDTQTVTIGGKVYTSQAVLTNVNGNFLIGADASESLDNLIAAINLGAGSGVKYAAAMTQHATVTAAAGAGDTMIATAVAAGTAGNAIATTETQTNAAWGAVTLAGGVQSYTMKVEKLLKA